MQIETLQPRSYADLLALVEAAPVVVPGAAQFQRPLQQSQASQPSPQATGQAPAPPAGGSSPAGGAVSAPPRAPTAREAEVYTEQQIVDDLQLVILGTVGDGKIKIFSRYHRRTWIVGNISQMKYENLLQLAGTPARSRVVDVATGEEIPGQYTIKEVKRAIAMLAGFRTITEGGEIGSGCWSGLGDDGKTQDSVVIVGAAEAAVFNGDRTLRKIEQPLARGRVLAFDQGDAASWYDFDQLSGLIIKARDKEFREACMYECIALLNRWRWRHSTATPIVFTGLIFASWVQTLWDWRPLISVIGPTSSGKSMLCKAVKGIFGALGKSTSDATSAGIRQTIATSAKIVMLDEFDAKDKDQAREQQKILKMFRTGGRGDDTIRGQANQKAAETHIRHMAWLLGIQIASPDQADRNRFISGELQPPLEKDRGKLTVPDLPELADLGQRMLATAIYCILDARKLATKIKDTRVPGVDDRVVESHAVPAAMLAVIQGQDEEAARATLREMLLPLSAEETTGDSDEQALMTDLLSARVQIRSDRYAVSQLLESLVKDGPDQDARRAALESVGLKIDHFMLPNRERGVACLLIAYKVVAEQLLKNSRWGNQAIDQLLRRIPGAVESRRRVGGQRVLTVGMPLEFFVREFLGLDTGLPAGGSADF